MKKAKLLPLLILLIGSMSGNIYAQSEMKRTTKVAEYKAFIQKQKAESQINKAKAATRKTTATSQLSAEKKSILHQKLRPKMSARMEAKRAERAAKSQAAAARFKHRKQTH